MRQKLIFFIILGAFLFFHGCKTTPPVKIEDDVTGGIVVKGSPAGAAIFLDGVNTGKTLPDTLLAKAGTHALRVEKDGYVSETRNVVIGAFSLGEETFNLAPVTEQKLVIIEDFANVSCVPCVTSNRILRSLETGTLLDKNVIMIKYHVSYPSPQDPFYQANKASIDTRAQFYKIFSTPTTYIDGKLKPVSSDSNQIKQYVDQQLGAPARFRMSIKDSTSGGVLYSTVNIKVLDLPQVDSNETVLHVYAVQTETSFSTPPGSNGETLFHNVVRGFLTGSGGIIPHLTQNGQDISFNLAIAINSGWDLSKLRIIAFLQNKTTKEIYQSAISKR
ncbi:MAG: PEGA domain-containing protein [Ignavibacteria bacterium]|nr:PEGA domain-containing protein [Ignavibacteria bacterium]